MTENSEALSLLPLIDAQTDKLLPSWDGYCPGRKANKTRRLSSAVQRFNQRYFYDQSMYDKKGFENYFNMPRELFERIFSDLDGRGVLKHRTDSIGIHNRMHIITALRLLAYGMSFDQDDKVCRISEISVLHSFKASVAEIVKVYGKMYLRKPNEVNLWRFLAISAYSGFPGLPLIFGFPKLVMEKLANYLDKII